MLPNEISNRTRNSCRAVLIGSQAARLGPLVTPTGLVTALQTDRVVNVACDSMRGFFCGVWPSWNEW